MPIWDFSDYKTADPPYSIISDTSSFLIENTDTFELINNEVLVYVYNRAYTFCQFTPSPTSRTICTPTHTGSVSNTSTVKHIASSIVLDSSGSSYSTMYVCFVNTISGYPYIECL